MSRRVRKVLLVDDMESQLRAWARDFKRYEIEVSAATSRAEAKDLISRDAYDLVIIDMCLGFDNGFDVLRDIRECQPSAFVIMVSAVMSVEHAMLARSLQASWCFVKPISCLKALEIWEQGVAPPTVPNSVDARPTLDEVEWEHISRALHDTHNNVARAAALLGIHSSTLWRKLSKRGVLPLAKIT